MRFFIFCGSHLGQAVGGVEGGLGGDGGQHGGDSGKGAGRHFLREGPGRGEQIVSACKARHTLWPLLSWAPPQLQKRSGNECSSSVLFTCPLLPGLAQQGEEGGCPPRR